MLRLPLPRLLFATGTATLAIAFALPPINAEAPLIRVGISSIDITPQRPIRLSGYGNRQKPSDGVAMPLSAKALAIGEDDNLSVLVTFDAIGVPAWLSKELAERLEEEVGVQRANFAIAASHTHCAPALDGNLPFMFISGLAPDEVAEIKRYTREVLDKLERAALEAIERRKPSRIDWTKGQVGFAANRRVMENGKWAGFGVQDDGPVDHSLPLMRVRREDGSLAALFANYACHCTTIGGDVNQVHGDWAGAAQIEIERRHPGTTALIAIGCGADQNPEPRRTVAIALAHGNSVADEVDRLLGENRFASLGSAPAGRYREIELPLETPPDRAAFQAQVDEGEKGALFAQAMIDRIDAGQALESSVTYPIQSWTFGDDLAMIFLAGEVVVDYALRFYREYDADRLWINAYANDVPCYIPSKRLYPEGGYELDGSMIYYGKPARLSVDTEDRIAGEVMRQMPRGYLSDETRALMPDPIPKERALETVRIDDAYDISLVAAEPLVMDPIDIAWGLDGRLWVVEMTDYPQGVDGKPGGRVRFLEDTDGDGTYDRTTLFLDVLRYPDAVMPWRDGALVVTADEILFARDTDGDGRADERQAMLNGFEAGNPQHQIAGLQWGLDNWIHIANDVGKGSITSVKTGETFDLGSRDLRFNPDTGAMDPQSGNTQYGRVRDDWGNWFGCSNSWPWWHYALADQYLRRNPHVAFPNPKVHLGEPGPAPPVYPASRTLSRFNDYDAANRFTSACSVTPYRDTLLGDLAARSLFVAEPVHNLVSRIELEPEGATFEGRRIDSERSSEFLAFTDNWSRPTSIRTGPDGALYVVDMYRQSIEHPQWIPDRWQWKLNLRAGSDKGRIYRIVPKNASPRPIRDLSVASIESLVSALETPNGTTRDLIHQALIWKNDSDAIPLLANALRSSELPATRVQVLSILDGLDAIDEPVLTAALGDAHPAVRRHAIRLAEPMLSRGSRQLENRLLRLAEDPDSFVRQQLAYTLGSSRSRTASRALATLMRNAQGDPYLEAASLSSALTHSGALLEQLEEDLLSLSPFLREGVIRSNIGSGNPQSVGRVLNAIATLQPRDERATIAQWNALSLSLAESAKRGIRIDELDNPTARTSVQKVLDETRTIASDGNARGEIRIAAIGMLGANTGVESDHDTLIVLASPRQGHAIQRAAIKRLVSIGQPQLASRLIDAWDRLGSQARQETIRGTVALNAWTHRYFDAIEQRPEFARFIDASQRATLLNSYNSALRRRAETLFAKGLDSDRQAALDRYADALKLDGDFNSGAQYFEQLCATCHRIGEIGHHVGPDLNALTNKSRDALLRSIIDPNQAVEEKYAMHLASARDGRSFAGVVSSETGTSITLLNAGGIKETVLRSELDSLNNSGVSLMPAGLEAALDPQSMANLLVFLQGERATQLIAPNAEGSLKLTARSGRPEGPSVRFDPTNESLSWIGSGDSVEWQIGALPAGRYAVFFYSGLQADEPTPPSAFELSIGDRPTHGVVELTTQLFRMRKRQYGEIEIPESLGETTIRFQHSLSEGQVSIREIAFIPVR